jgi:serine/threonine protein kinase
LNRLPPQQPKIESQPHRDLHKTAPDIGPIDSIRQFEVEPMKCMSGRIIGKGAFAPVTSESDPKNPANQIAVKWFRSLTDWASFLREVQTLVKLRHPCIIEILAWCQGLSNTVGIQMKLATNGALTDHLVRGSQAQRELLWKPDRKALLICDIVLGMRYVHARGIIHRDLKPDNLLLDDDLRVMISDFGLSRSQSATGLPSPQAGTYAYAAPEQWNAIARYTDKVDVFAFGLVAYEILTGRPVQRDVASRLPVPPASFGPPLMENVIRRCWRQNLSDRPSFQDIFIEFQANGWAILPGADPVRIGMSVAQVLSLEDLLNR